MLLVGAGHAHLVVLRSLCARPLPVPVTLVTPESHAVYSGLVPGAIAGDHPMSAAQVDLTRLAKRAGVKFIQASATGLDPQRRSLECSNGARLEAALISLDLGGMCRAVSGPGLIPIKPLDRWALAWHANGDAWLASAQPEAPFCVVGGGIAAVELAIACAERAQQVHGALEGRVHLISGSEAIAPGEPVALQRRLSSALARAGVQLSMGQHIQHVDDQGLTSARGHRFAYRAGLVATGVAPSPWLAQTGIATTAAGWVAREASLASRSHPWIWASGDMAEGPQGALPKAGVHAVRQGEVLARNLRRAIAHSPLETFRPQRRYLSLIRSGAGQATGRWGRWCAEGEWVSRWKSALDHSFVDSLVA